MITTTAKNRRPGRSARRITVVLVAAAALAVGVTEPASAAGQTLRGLVRDSQAAAQSDFPALERTCRSRYGGWPTNERVEVNPSGTGGSVSGRGQTAVAVQAVLDCLPPR